MSRRSLHCLFAFGTALFAAAAGRAQLAAFSPFMPPQGSRGSTPTANAPLEFRGIAELPGGMAFRVVDPARKAGAWVKLNETDPDLGVVVKQHDAEHETVVVEYQGRTMTLPLHTAKVVSAGAAMPNAAQMVMPPPPALAATQPAPAALAVQQAQLDAVAAAVAQRRALRDQAQQQINQGVRIAPQVIQQQQDQRAQNAQQRGQNAQPNQNGQNNQNNQNAQNPQRQRGQNRQRQQ